MNTNLKIIVKGLPEDISTRLGNTIGVVIQSLLKAGVELDLRRLNQIILTTDFNAEMIELSKRSVSGNLITYTNEEYAVAVAKVFIFPYEGDFENILVFNANIASGLLIDEDSEGSNKELFETSLHYLHHELSHIHDNNKKLDGLKEWMLSYRPSGKNVFVFPLAEACWSEYFANYFSSTTASQKEVDTMVGNFKDSLSRTKPLIDKAIYAYRFHGDIDKLMHEFERHGGFLVKSAAYVLGYLDGFNLPFDKISKIAVDNLIGSYFEATWLSLAASLRKMRSIYPDNWKDISVYDELRSVIENYYTDMGLILSDMPNGDTYINVPFRPETTPPE